MSDSLPRPTTTPEAEWAALEAELTPVEVAYRRERVRPGGARDLAPDEHERLVERLRAAVALCLGAPGPVRERMRDSFRATDRLARQLEHVTGRAIARVGALSADAPSRSGGGSARAFLAEFEQSAFFREDVAPYLNRGDLPWLRTS